MGSGGVGGGATGSGVVGGGVAVLGARCLWPTLVRSWVWESSARVASAQARCQRAAYSRA